MSRDRLAIVTGASTGIGQAIAIALAGAGWHVAFTHLPQDDPAPTRDAIAASGRDALARASDAGIARDVEAFHAEVEAWRGPPDLLVNNAGVQSWAPLLEISEEDWDRTIRTNLKGCFLNTQSAGRRMRARQDGRGGAIINIGSGCNKLAFPDLAAYTASKGGIEQFTKAAALELGPFGIRVNCVAPGAILTPRTAAEGGDYASNWARITPLRRIGTPEDVARVVLHLAGADAAFVTGQTIHVDGGVFSQAAWAS